MAPRSIASNLLHILSAGSTVPNTPPLFEETQVRRETTRVSMRDGVMLVTDIYFPPVLPGPVVARRTPYGRRADEALPAIMAMARRGYVVVSQDCRGTGDSEPDTWDYFIHEREDGFDFVEWLKSQPWSNGFHCSFGASYVGATQWGMATNPAMSAIAPEVVGLQVTRATVRKHLFVNAYPLAVGKGRKRRSVSYTEVERLIEKETLATGFFNEPLRSRLPEELFARFPSLRAAGLEESQRRLWDMYTALPARQAGELLKKMMGVSELSYVEYSRLPFVFDARIPYGWHTIPAATPADVFRPICAPALLITGWYDWSLGDLLTGWGHFRRHARREVASRSRLLIAPSAHSMPGYHEGVASHPELTHNYRYYIDLLILWFEAVRDGCTDEWPAVTYYLMGANEWRTSSAWPVVGAREKSLYLQGNGGLSWTEPVGGGEPETYTYDPSDPTPTVGGSILSYLYLQGSCDVSSVQRRPDVLTYTTKPLERDIDVVGPLRLVLYASSSAVDTDFAGRVSDVFPDGRAIQLQNGILRARYRNVVGVPVLLKPGRVYRLEIDLWATANRFKTGHRIRVDISSADFPRFDRNANRGGTKGTPIPARQTVYHDRDRPSRLCLSVLSG